MSSLMAKGVGQINALGTHRTKGATDLRSPIKKQVGHCFLLGVTERQFQQKKKKKNQRRRQDREAYREMSWRCKGEPKFYPHGINILQPRTGLTKIIQDMKIILKAR